MRRRAVLAGGAAWLAAPLVRRAAAATPSLESIVVGSGVSGLTGAALVDVGTGAVVEGFGAGRSLLPASVAKVVTTLYALDALGPDYRFRTEVRAGGPIDGGVLRGDLALVGSGDPVLDTDGIGGLVEALAQAGLGGVEGRFLVAAGALPAVAEIDPDQPIDAGYNATVSGMNLNFNRVFLAWGPGEAGPRLAFSAPGARFNVDARGFGAELVPAGPIGHSVEGGREIWALPRADVKGKGSVWLPVRAPGRYAGAVFGQIAADAGLALPTPEVVAAAPGAVVALRDSPALAGMLRDMLRYSTNLTAEAVGLRASQARGAAPDGLGDSASAMTAWARRRYGLEAAVFANHSGLSDRSRITAGEMAAVLAAAAGGPLPDLLRERPILDAQRQPVETDVRVVAKTGTLNFASGLAGYMDGRRRLAFALFAADPALRARVRPEERDNPPGGAAWAARARGQQQAILRRWAELYA